MAQEVLGTYYSDSRWRGMKNCSKNDGNMTCCRLPPQTAPCDLELGGWSFHWGTRPLCNTHEKRHAERAGRLRSIYHGPAIACASANARQR